MGLQVIANADFDVADPKGLAITVKEVNDKTVFTVILDGNKLGQIVHDEFIVCARAQFKPDAYDRKFNKTYSATKSDSVTVDDVLDCPVEAATKLITGI